MTEKGYLQIRLDNVSSVTKDDTFTAEALTDSEQQYTFVWDTHKLCFYHLETGGQPIFIDGHLYLEIELIDDRPERATTTPD